MRQGWDVKKLSELSELITKGTTPTSVGFQFTNEGVNFIKVESLTEFGDIIPNKVAYISETCHLSLKRSQLKIDDILFSIAGALGRVGIVKKEIIPANTNQALAIIRLKKNSEILTSYLAKYFGSNDISQEIEKLQGGAAQQNLSLGQLSDLFIPFPSLAEQQRIVAILDEAFDAIAKAKANTEQNLKNARELFESYLQSVFENNGNCEERPLEECFKLKSGDLLTSKMMGEDGKYPVFGGNGIAGFHTYFNLNGNNVIIGRVGALCGNARNIVEPIWLTDNAFKVVDFKYEFDNAFLTYLLNFKNLRNYARQAAQPVISNSSLKDVVLRFPSSITEQKIIVEKLNALSAQTKKLEAIYQQKIADLEELKKSLLQKAFNGELKTLEPIPA